jgi:hypothetical protein
MTDSRMDRHIEVAPENGAGSHDAASAWSPAGAVVVATVLRLLALIVVVAVLVGLGSLIWDRVVNNPLPHRDPEAREIAATAWK